MPCRPISRLERRGMKWVSSYPGNRLRGLPNINGLIVLNDPETGLPLAVMDATWITAKRTGAATAIAAKSWPGPGRGPRVSLAAEFKERATSRRFGRSFRWRIIAYDKDPVAAQRFLEETRKDGRTEVITARTPFEAVKGCDVVVTAGPITKVPTPRSSRLARPRGLRVACPITIRTGIPGPWPRRTSSARTISVSSNTRKAWVFQDDPPVYAELGDLVSGRKAGRESDLERTIACNLGLALDDMATAPLVYRKSLDLGIGTWLPL